jgi:hypothetical protein
MLPPNLLPSNARMEKIRQRYAHLRYEHAQK